MSILIDAKTRVICQGITGSFGALHTKGCLDYGTAVVGGVTPGRGGTRDANGLPIFNTVRDAVAATHADATMIFVPPAFCGDAILEAIDARIRVIIAITEGVPVQDMVRVRAELDRVNATKKRAERITLVGPNCPGVITPGPKSDAANAGESAQVPYTASGCKIGIMPGYINMHITESPVGKAVGIVSRSGTLTYEAVWQTSQLGLAQSTCVGIGGDPVRGFGFVDCLDRFERDPDTDAILMIGEIGGTDEEEAAQWYKENGTKPIAGFIAGRTAPPGRRMGHAGAIISGGQGDAESKIKALRAAGFEIAETPADMGSAMARAMKIAVPEMAGA